MSQHDDRAADPERPSGAMTVGPTAAVPGEGVTEEQVQQSGLDDAGRPDERLKTPPAAASGTAPP